MFSVFDLLVLSQIPQIGQHRLRNLVSHFGDPSRVLLATARELAGVEGFSKTLATTLARALRGDAKEEAQQFAEKQLSKLNKIEGRILTYWDPGYPEVLRKIYDPPPFLFIRGEFAEADRHALAIVGTRSPSDYGIMMAEALTRDLTTLGITIVSGLARGVDTIVHSETVKAGGRTLAVIGSGLDVCYPPENRNLSERILRRGAVISEYDMGAKPDAVNFPRRNRLISGLALGTLIIESDINGGAMITASMALDQNREVFALPGPVGSKRSRGCHALIKEGRAKLIENADDIVDELAGQLRPLLKRTAKEERKAPTDLTLFERRLFDVLSSEPAHIDAIADHAHLSTADTLVSLLSLEFKGLVRQLPGKLFLHT